MDQGPKDYDGTTELHHSRKNLLIPETENKADRRGTFYCGRIPKSEKIEIDEFAGKEEFFQDVERQNRKSQKNNCERVLEFK